MAYYPIFLELSGRPCLVVGGGRVALGKVTGLLTAGARVQVVSPALDAKLHELLERGEIAYSGREYEERDLDGIELVFVATDATAVNARVAADCRKRHLWVNAADDPANCDFILPSIVRKGAITLAASTSGSSPALARRLREELEAYLTDDLVSLADLVTEVRRALRERGVAVNADTWQKAMDEHLRDLLAQQRLDEARDYLLARLGVAHEVG